MKDFDRLSESGKMIVVLNGSIPYFAKIACSFADNGNIDAAWQISKVIGFISDKISELKYQEEETENV